jgi:LysR family transcriptional regulator, regulator of abg operon
VAPGLVRLVMPELQQRWPDIHLSVDIGTPAELVRGLEQGNFDFALCYIDDVALPVDIQHAVLQTLRAVVLVRQGHPLATGERVKPAALADMIFAGSPPYGRFLRWFLAQTGAEANYSFVGTDVDMAAVVVAASDMATVTSQGVSADLVRHHRLVVLDMDWPPFFHEVRCLTHANRPLGRAAQLVLDMVYQRLQLNEEQGTASTMG